MQSYNLGKYFVVPIAAGIAVGAAILVLQYRRGRARQNEAAYSQHLQLLFSWIVLLYLLTILCGLSYGLLAPNSPLVVASTGPDTNRNMATETIFGPFRSSLHEGSLTTILCVSGILFLINAFGITVQLVLAGLALLPGLALLLYGGWAQGTTLSTYEASTAVSMLGFGWCLGLESIACALGTTAGMNMSLALLVRRWTDKETRRAAMRIAVQSAVKLCGLMLAILLVEALSEVLYVHQVLLHGGTGVPLQPY